MYLRVESFLNPLIKSVNEPAAWVVSIETILLFLTFTATLFNAREKLKSLPLSLQIEGLTNRQKQSVIRFARQRGQSGLTCRRHTYLLAGRAESAPTGRVHRRAAAARVCLPSRFQSAPLLSLSQSAASGSLLETDDHEPLKVWPRGGGGRDGLGWGEDEKRGSGKR